jgi:predicted amidophosphoribosyltransferase
VSNINLKDIKMNTETEAKKDEQSESDLKQLLYCTSCGYDVDELIQGYCEECAKERQRELNEFNHRFEWWESLSDEEREAQIKNAV